MSLTLIRRSRTPVGTPHQRGGFLLEVALVLAITGVLTVGAFEVQSAMRKRQESTQVRNVLRSVEAALRAFTLSNGRLACPAQGGQAVEVAGPGGCGVQVGQVPFITLGMEVPRLPEGQSIKYGVSAQLISASNATNLSNLIRLASDASQASGSTQQVYVAARDPRQLFTQCDAASFNPAYALMWMPAGGANVPGNCFREEPDGTMGLLAVGGLEFLGWLHAKKAPRFETETATAP